MAVQEEVVVNLKVQGSGFDQTISGMEKVSRGAKAVDSTIQSLTNAFFNLGVTILRGQAIMKAFNLIPPGTHKVIDGLQVVTKELSNQFNRGLIPALKLAGKLLIRFAPAILAVVGAVKLWSDAMKAGALSVHNMNIVTNQLSIFWNNAAFAVSQFTDVITTFGRVWLQTRGFITESTENLSRAQEKARTDAIASNLAFIAGNEKLISNLNNLTISLRDQNLTTDERIGLMEDQATAQKALNVAQVESLEDQRDVIRLALAVESNLGKKNKLLEQEFKITAQLLRIKNRNNEIDATTKIRVDNLADSYRDIAADARDAATEIARMNQEINAQHTAIGSLLDLITQRAGIDSEAVLGLFGEETGLMETFIFGPFINGTAQEQVDRNVKRYEDGLDRIHMVNTDHLNRRKAQLEQAIAFEEFFNSTAVQSALAAAKGITNIIAESNADNLEAQKAARTTGVVIDTAAAIASAWIKPGWPGAIPLTIAIAANGVAQIAAIQNASSTITGQSPLGSLGGFNNGNIETASPDFFRSNQSRPATQAVLYKEDVDRVNTRVEFTDERASIGG